MGKAWIDGAEAPVEEAVTVAARLIAGARLPTFTGLQTDVAGIKAALALAKLSGGVVDHSASDVLYRTLEVLRASGMFVAAPAEMRRRADRFLLVGGDAAEVAPALLGFLFGGVKDLGRAAEDGAPRGIVWLGGDASSSLEAGGIAVETVPCATDALSDAVGMIRASLGGRRFGEGPIAAAKASEIAAWLGGASFACVPWSAPALGGLGAAMVSGLVDDLNAATRASSVPLLGRGQAWSAAQVATAVAGYPLRVSFAGGAAEHDPWAYAAGRVIASGESDLVVHVSALDGCRAGDLRPGVPVIAIRGEDAGAARAAVAFAVGLPGRDHAGVLYQDEAGSFVPVEASGEEAGGEGGAVSAAEILVAIAAALPDAPAGRAARC